MIDLTRREALRGGAIDLSGLFAGPVLAGCGTSSATSARAVTPISDKPGEALAPFDSNRPARS